MWRMMVVLLLHGQQRSVQCEPHNMVENTVNGFNITIRGVAFRRGLLTAWSLGLDRESQYSRSTYSNAVRWVKNCTSLVDERLVCCGLFHLQPRSIGKVSAALTSMCDFEDLL